jgi:hypothetical protein
VAEDRAENKQRLAKVSGSHNVTHINFAAVLAAPDIIKSDAA